MAKQKKATWQELKDQLDRSERMRFAHERMTAALASGERPIHAEVFRLDDGCHYRWALYQPTAAHGGLVLKRFRAKGQTDSYSVEFLDDMVSGFRTVFSSNLVPFQTAVMNLSAARERAFGGWPATEPRQTMENDESDGNDNVSGL